MPGFGTAGEPGVRRLTWPDTAPEVLAFARTDGLVCVVNLADEAAELPPRTPGFRWPAAPSTLRGGCRATPRSGCAPDRTVSTDPAARGTAGSDRFAGERGLRHSRAYGRTE